MTETTPLRIAGAAMIENNAELTHQAPERIAHVHFIDAAAFAAHLTKRGHDGWNTVEHDTILADTRSDEGPVADVRTSADILRAALGSTA